MRTMDQAKHPVTGLAGPYGHPVHPALVAIPIGAWVASFAFDVASRVVADGGFLAEGSRWLIALGVLGALAAAMTGFLDLFAIPTGTPAHRTALTHMAINLTVTTAYTIGFVIRGDNPREVGWGQLVLSATALAALGFSGYLGGKLAFRYGVRVADEATQLEGYRSQATRPHEENT